MSSPIIKPATNNVIWSISDLIKNIIQISSPKMQFSSKMQSINSVVFIAPSLQFKNNVNSFSIGMHTEKGLQS